MLELVAVQQYVALVVCMIVVGVIGCTVAKYESIVEARYEEKRKAMWDKYIYKYDIVNNCYIGSGVKCTSEEFEEYYQRWLLTTGMTYHSPYQMIQQGITQHPVLLTGKHEWLPAAPKEVSI